MHALRLEPNHAAEYRAFMLQAYANEAEAFQATVAEREALPLEWWISRVSDEPDTAEMIFGVFRSPGSSLALLRQAGRTMAEPLKNHYGPEIPRTIARMIGEVHSEFPTEDFLAAALDGYENLELMPRGRHIGDCLHRFLPEDYAAAVDVLLASLGPKLEGTGSFGMAPFLYFPHCHFVATYGLEHFEASMHALYELTQRFSAEFSIRPFLELHTAKTLRRLQAWTRDPNPHVRRLVSEGSRPRLPWASRLRVFEQDPQAVLDLLELLKDDPSLYVRRSVANHLNDIGKLHPALLVEVARRWMKDACPERRHLVGHALRTAVKRGDREALEILGFGDATAVALGRSRITPERVPAGGSVLIAFELANRGATDLPLMVDFRIHFVKANGSTNPKVFKLKALELAPGETVRLEKKLSLQERTTRKHYPGIHAVDALVNGRVLPLGTFELLPT